MNQPMYPNPMTDEHIQNIFQGAEHPPDAQQ